MVLGFATATEFPRSAITPLLSAKVLAHYDPSKRILLQCDASNYNIHYKAVEIHTNADCLSRLSLPVTRKSEPEEHVLLRQELDRSPANTEQLRLYTGRDLTLAHVREYLMPG